MNDDCDAKNIELQILAFALLQNIFVLHFACAGNCFRLQKRRFQSRSKGVWVWSAFWLFSKPETLQTGCSTSEDMTTQYSELISKCVAWGFVFDCGQDPSRDELRAVLLDLQTFYDEDDDKETYDIIQSDLKDIQSEELPECFPSVLLTLPQEQVETALLDQFPVQTLQSGKRGIAKLLADYWKYRFVQKTTRAMIKQQYEVTVKVDNVVVHGAPPQNTSKPPSGESLFQKIDKDKKLSVLHQASSLLSTLMHLFQ